MKKIVCLVGAAAFVLAFASASLAAKTFVNAAGMKVTCVADEMFTPQKKLQACKLAADTTFGKGGGGQVTCQGGAHVNFNDRGIISTCTVAQRAKNSIFQYSDTSSDQVNCRKGEAVVFNDRGHVEECVLAVNTAFRKPGTNMAVKCKAGGVVLFGSNGSVRCR
jgi:hypothetical protein